jgi:integrase
MSKEATGELRPLADGFAARITIEGRMRKDFVLTTCATEAEAEQRCKALAQMAARLRRAGHAGEVEQIVAWGAKARAGRHWEAVCVAADTLCAGRAGDKGTVVPTFADFAKEWTDGKLAKKYPDHVPAKDTADDDARLLKLYINPVLADLRLNEVGLSEADDVMGRLPPRLSASTRRHVGQVVRRVLALAVYPARYIRENPIPRGWLPRGRTNKAFTCLWPKEDEALLRCVGTGDEPGPPLVRRLFFGVLAREGMRREEAASLRWRDLDLERGVVRLDENKTDDARAWALDPGVARALKLWRDHFSPEAEQAETTERRAARLADEHVFHDEGQALYVDQMAEQLRADLKAAGVTRAELFERTAVRQPIRVHDLRATFVTVSLANGKTETWVADRTGHRSSDMINRYRRQARTWGELGLGELLPLDLALPELAAIAPRLPHAADQTEVLIDRKSAESVGFEPSVPVRVHLISNQAPSATRTALRRAPCRRCIALSSCQAGVL